MALLDCHFPVFSLALNLHSKPFVFANFSGEAPALRAERVIGRSLRFDVFFGRFVKRLYTVRALLFIS